MNEARRLLRSDHSLLEIAGRVGYASEAAFQRAFKKQFEEPPGAFRRRLRTET